MSWPSFYGYKYTPIGLRQREVKDESGAKTYSTTVHLPLGGHLLDIERRFNPDGSVSKRETSCYNPDIPECRCAPSPVRTIPRAVDPLFADEFRPSYLDLERQADDIIANFRARQGTTGFEQQVSSAHQSSVQQAISSSRKLVSTSEITSTEESALTSSRELRRQARNLREEF